MGASWCKTINRGNISMSSYASLVFLFIFVFLTSFKAYAQNPYFQSQFCPKTTTYSRNSTYFTNLKTLLSSLSSPNASYSTGFQSSTAGQAPDKVTGLFLCRGDVTTEVCRNCVNFSVKETLKRCPNGTETVLYYDECMIRYSDRNILSTVTYDGGYINNGSSYNQEDGYEDFVWSTMNQAAVEAASSPRKFYTRKVDSTTHQTLFVLVQCTPDLRSIECLRCLQKNINGRSLNNFGGRLVWPSCNSRYELYPFYNETAAGITLLPPASSPPVSSPRKGGNSIVLAISIVLPITVAVLVFIAGYCWLVKRKKKSSDTAPAFEGDDITTIELLQLDYRIIQGATNDYSENNKIGQGGFGEVYKGTYANGTEVAVKRLSKTSAQGAQEFKNEVAVVAKLHHKNLVKLLGFCMEDEEKILVYEFVANKSLDNFLFDPTKQRQLDWNKRYNIIVGITRGLLYLHQDSQLKIIHRDLKAGNILLDADMNPKIADFGMARIFGLDQSVANTKRIVWTFGYMPPEYVMHGRFSMKSDVYSFGVLVLEIISGKKTSSFNESNNMDQNLVTHAWRLWRKGSPVDLVVPTIAYLNQNEVRRCIHIALLCVQKDPKDRPTLSAIMLMLTSNTIILPVPRPPGFFFPNRQNQEQVRETFESSQSMTNPNSQTINDVTITDLDPR